MLTITGTSGDDTLSAYAPTNGFTAIEDFRLTINDVVADSSGFLALPNYLFAGQLFAISNSGDQVVFSAIGNNSAWASGETNNGTDLYIVGREATSIDLISAASDGTQPSTIFFADIPRFSPNDMFLAFRAPGFLLDGDEANGAADLFLKDLATGELIRVSESASGVQGDGSAREFFWIDNQTLFLDSSSSNLVDGETYANGAFYQINFVTGQVSAVLAGGTSLADQVISLPQSTKLAQLSISDNGLIAFTSDQDFNGAANDGLNDVYVYNPETGQYFRASTDSNGNSADPLQSFDSDGSYFPSISPDGTLVAFKSGAGNFVSDDFNQNPDIFVKNLQTGETIRISVPNEGGEIDDFYQLTAPKFSPDGTMVMFGAGESILGASEELQGIYIWSVTTGQITRIEVPTTNGLVIPQPHGGTSTQGQDSRGLDWLPDSSGILYTADNSLAEILFTSDINLGATINGLEGNDRISGTRNADVLDGGVGDDTVFGGRGDDSLIGGDGSDNLFGGSGNDTIDGGRQNDSIVGGAGNDTILGGLGADVLFGGTGKDLVLGGNRNDQLFGENGNDRVFGGNGDDQVDGGAGNDILRGGAQDDILVGNAGNDRAFGGTGSDVLSGGNGNDQLFGRGGFDILNGGAGDDLLEGGVQADQFIFAGAFGNDTITDFAATNNAERINLSAVGAISDFQDLIENHMNQVGADVVIDDGLGNTITLVGVTLSDLDSVDFVF